jgi:hypothetical protein
MAGATYLNPFAQRRHDDRRRRGPVQSEREAERAEG